jgi:cytochrome c1
MPTTQRYRFYRVRRLDQFPAYRAAVAAQVAVLALAPHWKQDPFSARRAHEACALMRRALAAGFSSPVGSDIRHSEHRAAWHAARQLDALVGQTVRHAQRYSPTDPIPRSVQRAIDRADVLISALPGVDLS